MNYADYLVAQPGMVMPLGVRLAQAARGVRLRGLGDSSGDPGTSMTTADNTASDLPATSTPPQLQNVGGTDGIGTLRSPFFWALSTVSTALSAFHGYRRNNSVGWGIWWGLMGGLFPVITPAIAVAQGFGRRAGR